MSSSSQFRAMELEQLRMELRRELRMEADVFEDDASDCEDENFHDAVVGTPCRVRRHGTRPVTTKTPTGAANAKAHAPLRVDGFSSVASPMRGLGSTPIAVRPKRRASKTSTKTKNRGGPDFDDDVMTTPSTSRAPAARSSLHSDRLVVLDKPGRNAFARDEARRFAKGATDVHSEFGTPADKNFGPFTEKPQKKFPQVERLRSPSRTDRLAGTYGSLAQLGTPESGRTRGRNRETRNENIWGGGPGRKNNLGGRNVTPLRDDKKENKAAYDENGRRVFSRSLGTEGHRRSCYEETPSAGFSQSPARLVVGRVTRRPVTSETRWYAQTVSPRRDDWETQRRPRSANQSIHQPKKKEQKCEKKKVIEYDLHGRRVERAVWCTPKTVMGRPSWSARLTTHTSSGATALATKPPPTKTKTKSTEKKTAPSRPSTAREVTRRRQYGDTIEISADQRRPSTSAAYASRPEFDPGPGGLGVENRIGKQSRRDTEKIKEYRPTRSPGPYSRTSSPSPSPSPRRESNRGRVQRHDMRVPIAQRIHEFREEIDVDIEKIRNDIATSSRGLFLSPSPSAPARNRETRDDTKEKSYDFDHDDEYELALHEPALKEPSTNAFVKRPVYDSRKKQDRETKVPKTQRELQVPDDHPTQTQDPPRNAFVDIRNETHEEMSLTEEDLSSLHVRRSRIRTPSSSGRRLLGGFGGSFRGAAAGIPLETTGVFTGRQGGDSTRSSREFLGGYHRVVQSAPVSPAATGSWMASGLGVGTAGENARANTSDGFDQALLYAASLADAPSPSRYAERYKTPGGSNAQRVEYDNMVRQHQQERYHLQYQQPQQSQYLQPYLQQQQVQHPAYYTQPAYVQPPPPQQQYVQHPGYQPHAHYQQYPPSTGQGYDYGQYQQVQVGPRPHSAFVGAAASFQRYSFGM